MSNNQTLQTILRESLRAYEHARAAHLRSQQAADTEYDRTTAELTAAEKAERARLEAEHRARRATAAGEQARLGDLTAAVTSLEEAARTALAQAGLAHIAGAPAAVDDPPAKARRGDAEVTQLFVQAQTGYVALREAIYRLAQAQVAAGQWDAARQTLKPLLAEKDAPLYEAAFAVQRESFLRPARQALEAGQWEETRECLAPWLKDNKTDKEAAQIERSSYLLPAQRALETGQWATVRSVLEPWLKGHKTDENAESQYCESLYRQAKAELQQGKTETAFQTFVTLNKRGENFKDAKAQLQQIFQSSLRFVRVPAGEFVYDVGSQRVNLPEYRIIYAPISFLQFKMFMDATNYSASPSGGGIAPVTNVSWDDATAFCTWAGVALPTEQQWVKAVCTQDANRRLEVGGVHWEWCANPHESGGYALRHYDGSSGVGCSSRGWCNSFSRLSDLGFRVVAP